MINLLSPPPVSCVSESQSVSMSQCSVSQCHQSIRQSRSWIISRNSDPPKIAIAGRGFAEVRAGQVPGSFDRRSVGLIMADYGHLLTVSQSQCDGRI